MVLDVENSANGSANVGSAVPNDLGLETSNNKSSSVTPGSVGSSCSDDTPGDTRSLTEEESDEVGDSGNKPQNQKRDMTEATEPTSFPASPSVGMSASLADDSPVPGPTETAPTKQELSTVSDDVTNTTRSPPKFYRLNASVRNSDDDDDDASLDEDLKVAPNAKGMASEEAQLSMNGSEALPRSEVDSANLETVFQGEDLTKQQRQQKGVRFSNVCIRDYAVTIGDSPFCSYGVPICLDWSHDEEEVIPIDFFEASHKRRRTARKMLLNSFQRRDMLWRSGYPLDQIEKAIKDNEREKFRRSVTLYFLPLFQVQELLYLGAEKVFKADKKQEVPA